MSKTEIVYQIVESMLDLPSEKRVVKTEGKEEHVFRNNSLIYWEKEEEKRQKEDKQLANELLKEVPKKSAAQVVAGDSSVGKFFSFEIGFECIQCSHSYCFRMEFCWWKEGKEREKTKEDSI